VILFEPNWIHLRNFPRLGFIVSFILLSASLCFVVPYQTWEKMIYSDFIPLYRVIFRKACRDLSQGTLPIYMYCGFCGLAWVSHAPCWWRNIRYGWDRYLPLPQTPLASAFTRTRTPFENVLVFSVVGWNLEQAGSVLMMIWPR
jgi:hypothetical protein